MAKVHESYDAGQFLTGNLNHFTVTKTGMASADMKAIVETTGTKATVVLLGAIDGNDVRIAVENNGAWDAAGLDAALGADFTVADFAY
jgi:uncharacterized protein